MKSTPKYMKKPKSPRARTMTAHERAFVGTDVENKASVERGLAGKMGALLGKLPFLQSAGSMYFCARDPATPPAVKAALFAALAYFVAPLDLVPDSILVAGYLDDAAIVAGAVNMFGSYINEGHRESARGMLGGLGKVAQA